MKEYVLQDDEVLSLIKQEEQRHKETIQLIAAENITKKEVLYPLASIFVSKTAEGTPGNRYHSGCSVVDPLERLAEERAKTVFKSRKVWVQPISGSAANLVVMKSILTTLKKGPDEVKMLAMGLDQGGHLSHGSSFHISKLICRNVTTYAVDKETGYLNYDEIEGIATEFKPDIIVCGASAYPRSIDFIKMSDIAKKNNSILLSDIAHIQGLVIAGIHQSPVKYSHFVTSSTYKAGGPKGGLIIAGDLATEEQMNNVTKALFPGVQSTPDFSQIASKCVFFKECLTDEFKHTQQLIVSNAKRFALKLSEMGYQIITGGTDNHIVLINVKKSIGVTGKYANSKLEACGIYVNKNVLPFDTESPNVGSGIRIGTNTISRIGMQDKDVDQIVDFIDEILKSELTDEFVIQMKEKVKTFMSQFSLDEFI